MLVRLIQSGLLALLALMPFHAFLTVWLGSLVGHRAILQGWKEALLVLLAGLAVALVVQQPAYLKRLHRPAIWAVMAMVALGLLVTGITRPSLATVLFGAKSDYEYLWAFVLAIMVATPAFLRRALSIILATAAVVISFGLLQVLVLPADFLTHFGYGPATIQPYLVLDPAVSSLRFASTLGGPNQLGTYLIIPLSLALAVGWQQRRWWLWLMLPTGGLVLIHTYSRSAWLGAAMALMLAALALIPPRRRAYGLLGLGALTATAGVGVAWLIQQGGRLQYYLLHSSLVFHNQRGSDFQHLASLRTGLQQLATAPFGHGVGTAGPGVFYTGVGTIIEDYYLQLGYETGALGLIGFVALIVIAARELWRQAVANPVAAGLWGALIGISANALVLPVWTDSTTALVFWIATGAVIGLGSAGRPHVTTD
ncbi:MAG TPA: hypothetical protein VLI05_04175 [Candidatus Saccharimonadia bacterium]|nr:hypothetical protein [Candidatus Saccharimonadia bacterium]